MLGQKLTCKNEGTTYSLQRTYHVKPIPHPFKSRFIPVLLHTLCGSVHRTMMLLHFFFFTFWGLSLCNIFFVCLAEVPSDALRFKAYFFLDSKRFSGAFLSRIYYQRHECPSLHNGHVVVVVVLFLYILLIFYSCLFFFKRKKISGHY